MPRTLGPICSLGLLVVLCSLVGPVNSSRLLFTDPASSSDSGSVKCSDPPEHCKPEGAACQLRAISECIPPFKCLGSTCQRLPSESAATTSAAKEQPAPGATQEGKADGLVDNTERDISEDDSSTAEEPAADTLTCGDLPKHCKPKGATCKLAKVSECVKPLKCDQGTEKCVDQGGQDKGAPGSDGSDKEVVDDSSENPEEGSSDKQPALVPSSTSTSYAGSRSQAGCQCWCNQPNK